MPLDPQWGSRGEALVGSVGGGRSLSEAEEFLLNLIKIVTFPVIKC